MSIRRAGVRPRRVSRVAREWRKSGSGGQAGHQDGGAETVDLQPRQQRRDHGQEGDAEAPRAVFGDRSPYRPFGAPECQPAALKTVQRTLGRELSRLT